MLGAWDFVVIVAVIVLIFGSRRIGRALRSLGTGGREFKRALRGEDELPPPKQPL
jgi:TatA/E family protein of Tat protein translocase